MIKSQRFLIYLALFVLMETLLVLFVDRPLSQHIRTIGAQHPSLINFFRAFTDVGKSKWYLWPSAFGIVLCALLARLTSLPSKMRRTYAALGEGLLLIFLSVALSGLATDALKPLLGRARPVLLEQQGVYGFHAPAFFDARWNAMPSGHATTAFALAWALGILLPRLRLPLMLVACFLAASRVMVNAHFLSDVVGGTMIGILVAEGVRQLLYLKRIRPLHRWLFPIDRREKSR